jgi:hypothetical protein
VIAALRLLVALAIVAASTGVPGPWPGVDETVVGEAAARVGRAPWKNLLDGQGDLPLFLFLCAGLAGGFALGYGYRALFVEGRPGR